MIYTFRAFGLQQTEYGLEVAIRKIPRELCQFYIEPSYSWAGETIIRGDRFLSVRVSETSEQVTGVYRHTMRYIDIGGRNFVGYDLEDTWISIGDNDPSDPKEVTFLTGYTDILIEVLDAARKAIEDRQVGLS